MYIAPVENGTVVFGGAPHYMTLTYSYISVPIEPDAISYQIEMKEHHWGWNNTNNIPF